VRVIPRPKTGPFSCKEESHGINHPEDHFSKEPRVTGYLKFIATRAEAQAPSMDVA